MTQVRRFAPLLFVLGLSGVAAAPSAQTDFSGIVSYVYEANPQGIKPKMNNWEIRLCTADSRNGVYEIVQINKRLQPGATAVDTTPNVIVDSKLVAVGPDGSIAFALYVGDKVPKENMGRRGNSGEPVILTGHGTGRGTSSWVVFPGSKIERATPSVAKTPLTDGTLPIIQFVVSNERGERFQTDVILRRKPS